MAMKSTVATLFLQTVFLLCAALDIVIKPSLQPADAATSDTEFSSNETKAITFLRRYGYLALGEQGPVIPLTRALFTNALNNYQVMADLPIKEGLDSDTLSSMDALRCGNADVRRSAQTGLARYEILAPPWKKNNLTYRVSQYPIGHAHLTRSVVDDSLRKATQMWSGVSRIDFLQIPANSWTRPDIDIRFERSSYDANCDMYFGMGELAHTTMTRTPAKVHFNGRVGWKVGLGRGYGVDLVAVAAHELGHVLGLDHSSDSRALMFASYRGGNSILGRDDVQAIQYLYGVRKPTDHKPTKPDQEPEQKPESGTCPKSVTRKMPDGRATMCAALYTDLLCKGQRLPIGDSNKTAQLNDEWDNEIASAEVNPGCMLKVCHRRGFSGGCIDLDGGLEGHNFNRMPLGFHRMVTSLACTCGQENDNLNLSTSIPETEDQPQTLQRNREPPAYIPNTDRIRTCAVLVESWKDGATRAWVEEEIAMRMPSSLIGMTYEYMATRRGCSLYYCTRPAFGGICELLRPSRHASSRERFHVGSLSCECK